MIPALAMIGVGLYCLYEVLTTEEKLSKERWESSQKHQRKTISESNQRIRSRLAHAQHRLQREAIFQEHRNSITLSNDAYALLNDAKTLLNGMNRQIQHLNHHRAQFQHQLEEHRANRNVAGVQQCIAELKAVNAARQTAFTERDRVRAEKDDLLQEVQTGNHRTAQLREQLEALGWVARSRQHSKSGR